MAMWITGSFSKGYVATYHDFYEDRVREGLDEYIDAKMTKENVVLMMPKYLPEDVATGKVKSKKPLKSYIDDYVNERMAPAIKRYNEKQKKKTGRRRRYLVRRCGQRLVRLRRKCSSPAEKMKR